MAVTYDSDAINFKGTTAEKRNALRFILQETESTSLFQDAELDAVLGESDSVWRAAITSLSIKRGNVKVSVLGRKKIEYWKSQEPTWASNARRSDCPVIVERTVTC